MTILVPMSPANFAGFTEECVELYALDNVRAGRWAQADALARAREEFARLLPAGLQTPLHLVHEIHDGPAGRNVGFLWFAILESGESRTAFVYSIKVKPEFRGRGHAKAALELVEPIARAHGATDLALHVFNFNTPAQALYRSLGYGITGLSMLKRLASRDA